jgi:hypothetical protein
VIDVLIDTITGLRQVEGKFAHILVINADMQTVSKHNGIVQRSTISNGFGFLQGLADLTELEAFSVCGTESRH